MTTRKRQPAAKRGASEPSNTTEPNAKPKHRIYAMIFASVYPLYIAKAERKGRTKDEVDEIIRWLTGYTQAQLEKQIEKRVNFETFFDRASEKNPLRRLIKGVICGVRIEEIEDPLMLEMRYLDKLVDELAKGKEMKKILRQPAIEPLSE